MYKLPNVSWEEIDKFSHKIKNKLQLSAKIEIKAKTIIGLTTSDKVKEIANNMIKECQECRKAIVEELHELDEIILNQTKKL